ncbi:hypothetical protein B0J11DRAFT_96109 [Dendryphion nanum]|uniref:DUF7053 domain-containing protein n=1 Tax=Dendryphion nanum TaxID=256645 RepID=A0A9P9IFE6_9PLEO|nr:hypothetical protein B0J11DRAFT_96109 [Dendryphion nanum]
MSKTSVFTTITPLPSGITRQSVMETYHNHIEMIELNPLVIEKFKCKPPTYAPSDEYYSTWYTIKDKVSYGLGSSSVSYHACFHDLTDGLQTHVYAPLGLDIRAKWSVGGSLPGEPKQPTELGLGIPNEGLYIREDVRMKCNIMMLSFVKKTFKESHSKLVDRLVEKAHTIESKFANERLKGLRTIDPAERMGHGDIFIAPPPDYQPNPGHMSIYSNGSAQSPLTSPTPGLSLSHASSPNSQGSYLLSPPLYTESRQSTFQQFQRQERNDSCASNVPELLSDKRYDPSGTHLDKPRTHSRSNSRSAGQFHTVPYQPSISELPSYGPPVPPKDSQGFAGELAELPA